MDKQLFQSDPRDYALKLVEDGVTTHEHLLTAALKYLSHDDCREMLDMNELSPRFDEDADDEEDCGNPDCPRLIDGGAAHIDGVCFKEKDDGSDK